MSHVATCIRIFASDPSDDLVEKRTAMIAKIPLVLSRHIAATFKPTIAQAAE